MMPSRPGLWFLRAAFAYNRFRLALSRTLLGERIQIEKNCDLWASCLRFNGSGRAVFREGCVVERGPFPLILDLEEGSVAEFKPGVWVRGKYRPNVITCFNSARVEVGEGSLLNGVIISARAEVAIGKKVMLSWDTAILDSHLHPLSNQEPLVPKPVKIGDHVLIAAGAIVLAGAEIGSHSIIGAGSVVTGKIPDHVIAAGAPARPLRKIADRDQVL